MHIGVRKRQRLIETIQSQAREIEHLMHEPEDPGKDAGLTYRTNSSDDIDAKLVPPQRCVHLFTSYATTGSKIWIQSTALHSRVL